MRGNGRPTGGTTAAARSEAAVALALVQVAIGYEWLVSGLTKIVHGDFPGGLAAALAGMAKSAPGWYRTVLAGAIEPHSHVFAYAIEWSELLVGLVLLAAVVSGRLRLASTAALAVGLALAANFELANGGGFGTHIAANSFDEGVDLDTIMVALQLALLLPALRRVLARRSTLAAAFTASS